jgi:PAS domain S-box-containing protein
MATSTARDERTLGITKEPLEPEPAETKMRQQKVLPRKDMRTLQDITERKQVDEALRASETRYRRLFEAAQDGILILDADTGKIVDVNPFLTNLLGFSREQFLGKKLWEIGLFKDIVANKDNFIELQRQEYIRYEDLPLETADGRRIDVEFVSNVYVVNHMRVIQCNIRNITERKQAEEALKESEKKFRETVKYLDEGYYSCTLEGLVLEHNAAFNRILGIGIEKDLKGTSLPDFWQDPADRKKYLDELISKGSIQNFQINLKTIQSENIFVLANSHIVKDKKGGVVRIEGTVTDYTERKKMSDQIEASLQGKETLLREVHHRVKNNLQIIISLLNLQSRFITDETTLSAFKESQNRVRAMALVHEKLYQSKDISKIDLDNYIRFLGDNLFQFLDMKGKGVTLTMDIRDISVTIDTAIPLGLMINELISNSLKYAFPNGRKGEISLVIHRQDHTIIILFKDNGVGIPENFDWRNSKSLGLRLVVSLVEQLSGTIELDRTAGTTFTVVVKEKE